MDLNPIKSDLTLQMQVIRMQFEIIAYCRIKRGISKPDIVQKLSSLWNSICESNEIIPNNNFITEYNDFVDQTVLKFAPDETLINMEEKAYLSLEKQNINRNTVEEIL